MASPLLRLLPELLVLLLFYCNVASAAEQKEHTFSRLDFDGRLYSDSSVLQEVVARSTLECNALCARNDQCTMSTFYNRSNQPTCRLFSTKNHAADSWESEEGARSFWVVTEIPVGGDCAGLQEHCVSGAECEVNVCRLKSGEACCSTPSLCKMGLACVGGVCSTTIGDECMAISDCAGGQACISGRCGPCPSGYAIDCGRCLKTVIQHGNVTTAQRHCHEDGGQLVMVKTALDVQCVWTFIGQSGWGHWVGANDSAQAGKYRWWDGTELPDDSDVWRTGANAYPDHPSPGADCVSVYNAALTDVACSVTGRRFVCQTPVC